MKLRVNVNGIDYEVEVEILDENEAAHARLPQRTPPAAPPPVRTPTPAPPPPPSAAQVSAPAPAPGPAAPTGPALTSPIPGTVVEIKVSVGQTFSAGETLIVIDAMKMNTPVSANAAGKVKEILVKTGTPVKIGQALMTFE